MLVDPWTNQPLPPRLALNCVLPKPNSVDKVEGNSDSVNLSVSTGFPEETMTTFLLLQDTCSRTSTHLPFTHLCIVWYPVHGRMLMAVYFPKN